MKNKKILIPVIAVTLLALITCLILFIRKSMPNSDYMSLNDYFKVEDHKVNIIMQDSLYETQGLLEDGQIYLSMELVSGVLNNRFYWDATENKLLYTTSTSVISTSVNSRDYYVNRSKSQKDYDIVKVENDTAYVAIDYVKEYTALDYKKYEKPDRAVITYRFDEKEQYAKADSDTALRYEGNIKSEILKDVKEGDALLILEKENEQTGFCKVMSEDGIIGYVKAGKMGDIYEDTHKTDFKQEKYPHILLDGKVNLVWHQVTNRSANSGLSDLLSSTKGINVISPTWFKTTDDDGGISSLADYSYIDKAHAADLQVWGLCDDFDPNMKIGNVLSVTTKRQRLEKNLIAEAIRYGLDGINIDFENVKKDNGNDFIQFIRELGIMCRNNGIVLSVDNYPPADYSQYYNRTEQAAVADYVITMAYDEYYAGSEEAGPVSSLSYVQNSTKNTIEQVPAEQTIIALPFYSRMWTEKTKDGQVVLSSEACSMKYAAELVSDAGVEPVWDDASGMYYAEYKAKGALHKIWLENAKSLDLKMQAVSESNAAGMGFWKLGLETSSIWDNVLKYKK